MIILSIFAFTKVHKNPFVNALFFSFIGIICYLINNKNEVTEKSGRKNPKNVRWKRRWAVALSYISTVNRMLHNPKKVNIFILKWFRRCLYPPFHKYVFAYTYIYIFICHYGNVYIWLWHKCVNKTMTVLHRLWIHLSRDRAWQREKRIKYNNNNKMRFSVVQSTNKDSKN